MNLSEILLLPIEANPRLIRAEDTGQLYTIAANAPGSTATSITGILDTREVSANTVLSATYMNKSIHVNGSHTLTWPLATGFTGARVNIVVDSGQTVTFAGVRPLNVDGTAIATIKGPTRFGAESVGGVWATPLATVPIDTLTAENGAIIRPAQVTILNPYGLGYEIVCSALYVDLFKEGEHFALEQDGFTVRSVHHCRLEPDGNMDVAHGYVTGNRRNHDDGRVWECVDAETATWELVIENLAPLALTVPPIDDSDNLYIIGSLFNGVVPVNFPTLYLDVTESLLTWKNEESLGGAADYSCYHDGDGNWTIFVLGDSAWVSDGAWASPDLVQTWIPLGDFTAAPIVIRDTIIGTLALQLGQLCIVTAPGGNTFPKIERDVFTCVQLSPVKWSPPGNLFKTDGGNWYRQAILPGTTAVDFGLAYD